MLPTMLANKVNGPNNKAGPKNGPTVPNGCPMPPLQPAQQEALRCELPGPNHGNADKGGRWWKV